MFKPQTPHYTATVGVIDYASGQIFLTDVVLPADRIAEIRFAQAADYAWVIQSANGTFGAGYRISHTNEFSPSGRLIYAEPDLSKLYELKGEKLTVNGVVKNIDYRYDTDWQVGSSFNRTHIWMENANVSGAVYGRTSWKEGAQERVYPRSIVLILGEGGKFTHQFSQNPPYYSWGNDDAARRSTPRALDQQDFANQIQHYLVYDLNSDQVVMLASGLSKQWSRLGDLRDFQFVQGSM